MRIGHAQTTLLSLSVLTCAQNTAIGVESTGTILTAAIDAAATSIPVATSSGFKAGSFAAIDGEIVAVCAIPDGSHLTIGVSICPNVDGRGTNRANGGSAAASHPAKAKIHRRVAPWNLSQAAPEVVAIGRRLSGLFPVVMKGDPTGASDSTVAANAAIGAANGGNVIFPHGIYLLGSLNALTQGVTIDFNGSTIKVATNAALLTCAASAAEGRTQTVLRNGYFTGATGFIPADVIKVAGCHGLTIRDSKFFGITASHAIIWNSAGYGTRLENVEIRGNKSPSAIYLSNGYDSTSGFSDAIEMDIDISHHAGTGISIEGGRNTVIRGVIESCSVGGIEFTGVSSQASASATISAEFESSPFAIKLDDSVSLVTNVLVQNSDFTDHGLRSNHPGEQLHGERAE